MNVVSRKALLDFWRLHPQAEGPLSAWYKIAREAEWDLPHDVREAFNSADFVGDNRVIFNVGGNKYRIIARISYPHKQMLIKLVGTHAMYDAVDPKEI